MMPEIILGLDIGGTKTAVLRGTTNGSILTRTEFPTPPECEAALARIFQETESHLMEAAGKASAISVSIGGPLDIERGIIYSPPNLPDWDAVPLKTLLQQRFALPVYVEHDGNAGAIAEYYFGAGHGFSNIVFLTMGTGLGGGLILNDRIYRGSTDLAGEVGHMRIAPDGPEAYGKKGSWEGFCSGPGMVRIARRRFPNRWGKDQSLDARVLTQLAKEGDDDALFVVRETGQWLGRGLAILLDVLNPQRIIIGSMAVRLGDLLLDPAREEMRREALPGAYRACQVVPAELGERLGDVAALCAAIQAAREEAAGVKAS